MADIAENATYTDAAMAISQGKRHLLVQDYTAAVTALAEGLEMMSQKLGDCDDELGEPYLLYGRALLGLAREEVGVLGGGVPGSDEVDEDDEEEDEEGDDEDEEEEEKASENDSKDEEMETNESEIKEEVVEAGKKMPSAKECGNSSEEKKGKSLAATSNKTDDKKIEEIAMETTDQKVPTGKETCENIVVPGTSKASGLENGSRSSVSKARNGVAGKSKENTIEEEDVSKEDEEEDPGRGIDLQVAWEVLELAKIVFTKRGESGVKQLAETHRLLGEVAMESDNPQGAIADLEGALELLEKIEPCEPRALADIHYQLGLAHSLANDFDSSIKQFNEATNLLEARIKQLEDAKEPATKNEDPFYTIEGEIKELRELLPAIKEKIVDMKDFKEEACRMVIEGIKNKVAGGGCTNGAGSSSLDNNAGTSSSSERTRVCPSLAKPASDISHLVRKKRKNDNDAEEQGQSPCKKATP